MKVLIINQYCGFGSTGKIVKDIHDMLLENNHECCIAYGRYHENLDSYTTYEIGNTFNIYEHLVETRLFDNHGFASRNATKKFIHFIEQYKPDIINIHNLHGYYINIKVLVNYLVDRNYPIVWTFHDCWNFSPHGGYIDYQEKGILPTKIKNKEELKEYPKAYLSIINNYQRKKKIFTKLNFLTIVSPSYWLSDMIKDSFFSKYPVETIHNGIDLTIFYPETLLPNSINKKIILGVASVWDQRKGLSFFNELAKNIDFNEYEIVIIGKLEEKINIHHRIRYIEQTKDVNELRKWYSQASVFVNPTLYDNFPTTNLEALACGTPVVTFNTGGSPESLNEKTGVIVYEQTVSKLFRGIKKAELLNSIDCREHAENFRKQDRYNEYLNLFRKLLNEGKNYYEN